MLINKYNDINGKLVDWIGIVLATLDEITDIVKNVEIALIIIDIKDKILSQNKFKIYYLK